MTYVKVAAKSRRRISHTKPSTMGNARPKIKISFDDAVMESTIRWTPATLEPMDWAMTPPLVVLSCSILPTRNLTSHCRDFGKVIFHVVGSVSSHGAKFPPSHCGKAQRSASCKSELASLGTQRFSREMLGIVA